MIGIQQLVFHVPQLIGEVHMHVWGLIRRLDSSHRYASSFCSNLPGTGPLPLDVSVLSTGSGFTVKEQGQGAHAWYRFWERGVFFSMLNGIKEKERIVSVEFLIHQADEISDNLSGFFS